MSVSVANQDPFWEQMVRGDQSQADILFHRHERELETFIKTQLRKFRRPESEWEDIAQECRLRILTLAQRLSLLHQHINTPALLTQLLAEFTELRDSAAPTQLSDLAGWLKRILKDQLPPLLATGSADTFRSALLQVHTARTRNFNAGGLLFAAVRSQLVDGYRASRHTERWADDFDPPAPAQRDHSTESASLSSGLAYCLQKLNDDDRSLVQIYYSGLDADCLMQELESAAHDAEQETADADPAERLRRKTRRKNITYAELAAGMGLSEGAFGKRFRKLLQQLKSCIQGQLGGVA